MRKLNFIVLLLAAFLVVSASFVGTYFILLSTGAINKGNVNITFNVSDVSKEYDGEALYPTEVVVDESTKANLPEGYTYSFVSLVSQTKPGETTSQTNIKILDKEGKDVTSNYLIQINEGKISVSKRAIELTFTSDSVTYQGSPYTEMDINDVNSKLLAGDKVTAVYTTDPSYTYKDNEDITIDDILESVQIYNLLGENVSDYYEITPRLGSYGIEKKILTISTISASKVYDGEPLTLANTKISNLIIEGLVEGHTVVSVDFQSDSITNVGKIEMNIIIESSFEIVIRDEEGNDVTNEYQLRFNEDPGTLEVTPAKLVVSAKDETIALGDEIPSELNWTYSGFVGGDTESVIESSFTYTVDYDQNDPLTGTYEIELGVVSAENYEIEYKNPTLTVTKKELIVTAKPLTITYGDPLRDYTGDNPLSSEGAKYKNNGVTYEGFLIGEDQNTAKADIRGELDFTYTYNRYDDIGYYEIIPRGLESDRYEIIYVAGQLTVTPRPITVTIDDKSSVYGDEIVPLTATVTRKYTTLEGHDEQYKIGIVNNDNPDNIYYLSTPATSTSPKGDYQITCHYINYNNYEVDEFVNATYTITPRVAELSWIGETEIIYDGNEHNLVAEVVNKVGTDEVTVSTNGPFSEIGDHVITASTISNENYVLPSDDSIHKTLSIKKAELIVKANNKSITYGDDPDIDVSYEGFIDGDDESDLGGTLVFSYNTQPNYQIGVNTVSLSGYTSDKYKITYVDGTLIVNKKDLTITANDSSITYGSDPVDNGVTYTGFVFTENESVLSGTLSFDYSYTYSNANQRYGDAGSYTITPKGLSSDNYNIIYVQGTLTVNKVDLTITANDHTITYGDPVSYAGITAVGLVNNDTFESIGGSLTTNYVPNVNGNAGTYHIDVNMSEASPNYNIIPASGTLTVSKKNITVTIDSKSSTYGDAIVELTATDSGLADGDSPSSVYSLTPTAEESSPVGKYNITGSSSNTNYNVTFLNEVGSYEITKKDLTVTIESKTSVYGDPIVALTATNSGLADGDSPSSVYLLTTAEELSPAGKYDIKGTVLSSNYNVTFLNEAGSYEITKKDLTIKANDKSITYGSDPENAGVTYTGFVPTEDASVLSGTLSYDYSYTYSNANQRYGDVETYTITPKGLSSDNYNIIYASGDLTVAPKAITIIIDSKSSVYGDTIVTLTADNSVLVNNDLPEDVYTLSTLASSTSPVGKYDITGTTLSTNYIVTFQNEEYSYEITKKDLTVTIESKTSVYGDPIVALTATDSGLANGDLPGDVYSLSTADELSPVGKYNITGTALSSNYNITFVNQANSYEITKRVVTIDWSETNKTYNGLAQTASASVSNKVGTDVVNVETTSFKDAGTHTVKALSVDNTNYALPEESITTTLEIQPKVITASFAAKYTVSYTETVIFNGNNLTPWNIKGTDYTLADVIGTDEVNAVFAYRKGTDPLQDSIRNYGDYKVSITGVDNPNYQLSDTVECQSTFSIDAVPLTIAISSMSKVYDGTPLVHHGEHTIIGQLPQGYTIVVALDETSITDVSDNTIVDFLSYTIYSPNGYEVSEIGEDDNFNVQYAGGSLTIIKKSITAYAPNVNITYNAEDFELSTLTPSFSGLVGTDSITAVVTSTPADPKNVGSYTLSLDNFSGDTDNYIISVIDGLLTITPKTATVNMGSYSKVYDGNPFDLDDVHPTITGVIGTDFEIDSITCSTSDPTNVGTYILYATLTSGANNYSVTIVEGSLTITPRTATVSIGSYSKVYDGTEFDLDDVHPTITGVIGTDFEIDSITCSTAGPTNVGTYILSASLTGNTDNYSITIVEGSLTINPKNLTITVPSVTVEYDGNGYDYSTLTATITGLIAGDDVEATINCSPANPTDAGTYVLYATVSGDDASNYNITVQNGTLTITKANLTIITSSLTVSYDGVGNYTTSDSQEFVAVGFKNGDDISDLDWLTTDEYELYTFGLNIGYVQDADADVLKNYNITYIYGQVIRQTI